MQQGKHRQHQNGHGVGVVPYPQQPVVARGGELGGRHGQPGPHVVDALALGAQPEMGHLPQHVHAVQQNGHGVARVAACRHPAQQGRHGPHQRARQQGEGCHPLERRVHPVVGHGDARPHQGQLQAGHRGSRMQAPQRRRERHHTDAHGRPRRHAPGGQRPPRRAGQQRVDVAFLDLIPRRAGRGQQHGPRHHPRQRTRRTGLPDLPDLSGKRQWHGQQEAEGRGRAHHQGHVQAQQQAQVMQAGHGRIAP